MSDDNRQPPIRGTFACPICGVDTPHGHSQKEIDAYQADMRAQDGWTSTACRQPKESGWYLCVDIEVPQNQYGEKNDFWHSHPKWSQLWWFKWVREIGARGQEDNVPEVLYWDRTYNGWQLRNYLGDAVPSGEESRYRVIALPKYWRELPPMPKRSINPAPPTASK